MENNENLFKKIMLSIKKPKQQQVKKVIIMNIKPLKPIILNMQLDKI